MFVCSRMRGRGGICESIEIPTSWCLYSIGFETDGDLPDGNLFSVLCFVYSRLDLGGVLTV